MSIPNCFSEIKPLPIIGYETYQRQKLYDRDSLCKDWECIAWDVGTKLLGYIPVLSILVGVSRLITAAVISNKFKSQIPTSRHEVDARKQIRRYNIGRGIIEILGFGVVPMVLDFSKAAITCAVIHFNKHKT